MYLEGVWMVGVSRVSRGCLEGVWRVSGGILKCLKVDTLEGVWMVYERCLFVCRVSGKCLEGVWKVS